MVDKIKQIGNYENEKEGNLGELVFPKISKKFRGK